MQQYILSRVIQGFFSVLLVSLAIFLMLRVAPGDVALQVLTQGQPEMDPETVNQNELERVRKELGLDKSLPVQYLVWLKNMATFDWGKSFYTQKPIIEEFKSRAPVTLQLGFTAIILALMVSMPLGIMMALKRDTWMDYVGRIVSLAGLSLPSFWTATMVITVGSYAFNWSPRLLYVSPWEDFYGNLAILFWPAVIFAYVAAATQSRMMRSTMLEVLRQDYIRTAHAKGLSASVVVYRHAMKNALLPVVTIVGISLAVIIGGSVITETIFQLPGVGVYLVRGLNQRDFPVVETMVALISTWIIMTNLAVDVTYAWLDPRIRF